MFLFYVFAVRFRLKREPPPRQGCDSRVGCFLGHQIVLLRRWTLLHLERTIRCLFSVVTGTLLTRNQSGRLLSSRGCFATIRNVKAWTVFPSCCIGAFHIVCSQSATTTDLVFRKAHQLLLPLLSVQCFCLGGSKKVQVLHESHREVKRADSTESETAA